MPRAFHRYIRSWQQLQPTWQYLLHTDAENEALVTQEYRWLRRRYQRLSAIQRADMMRYIYMHRWGGVYADLDVGLLRPLAPLIGSSNASVLLGQEPLAHALLLESRARQVCNAVIISVPRHPFWLHVLREISRGSFESDPVGSTGPRMLERLVRSWHDGARPIAAARSGAVAILPPELLYPTFDPMQSGTLRSRCSNLRSFASAQQLSQRDTAAAQAVCTELQAHRFQPWVPVGAFTNHYWSHTWIRGAEKVNTRDAAPL